MHMHLHAACDHGASMAMHMFNARQLGMRYLWFTDHDTRTGVKSQPVNGFEFDGPGLIKEEPTGGFYGFKPLNEAVQYQFEPEKEQLILSFGASENASWQESGIYFVSSGTRHSSSLAAEVTLSIDVEVVHLSADSRLIFDITLSQRPPGCEKAHLLYVFGSTEGLEAPHTQIIPLPACDGKIVMPISRDVSEALSIGGRDNAFDTFTVRLQARSGVESSVALRDFQIQAEKSYEQVHQALKEAAAKAGAHYGITPFVSFEVSGAGEHKNCYSTHVPTIDYQKYGYNVPVWDAVKHIKDHCGIFSINHPFAISDLKRKVFTPVERMQILAKMTAELVANRAYGADLIEVGFPEGRNGFSLEEYTRLWDMLSVSGMFLTGYGCSDSHRDNTGWFAGNNFAAYIGVPEHCAHPIGEKCFIDAMKAGRVYTADPVKWQGSLCFETEDGYPMGSVFLSESKKEIPLVFSAKGTKPGWQFRLIENGNTAEKLDITEESFTWRSVLHLQKSAISFQRAELWDETGRCVLLTNPIFLINTQLYAGEYPTHRIVEEHTK
ncbi:MAG: hypothetical protein IKK41_05505 [Oscillospiraceae bacterium]|nr:hypothetical protein [Oscillospiraceae bacterium]